MPSLPVFRLLTCASKHGLMADQALGTLAYNTIQTSCISSIWQYTKLYFTFYSQLWRDV